VQTVDFFAPVVDDPRTYGAIAAANAMSDVYAMGGEVLLALNIVAFPEDLTPDVLTEVLLGGAEKVSEAGGIVVGGHTVYDREPKYGLAVTGIVHPDRVVRKSGARPGDALLLTKPLGAGLVLTAAQRDEAGAASVSAAIESMLRLNRHASHLAAQAGVHAMTDVTGFGLLGHAAEIARASSVRLIIDAAAVPELPGALSLARAGVTTGGTKRNRDGLAGRVNIDPGVPSEVEELLYDPQTSGGLLMALGEAAAQAVAERLRTDGLGGWIIGRVEEGSGVVVRASRPAGSSTA
jgi:selenide,water dikinase